MTETRLVTQDDWLATVSSRWDRQYPPKDAPPDKRATGDRLRSLPRPLDAATVDGIIGNDDWTTEHCEHCSQKVTAIVVLGRAWDNEETMRLCARCIGEAWELLERRGLAKETGR